MTNVHNTLQDVFWQTRLEAKALYKAWQVTPDDSKLMQAYSVAWQAHQKANTEQFLAECLEEK